MDTRSFDHVSAGTWERLRDTGRSQHGTVFKDEDANRGTATTATPFGALVLGYDFDPSAERITYTIVSKPLLAPSSMIWGGVESALDRCRRDDTT